ncbi:MAG: hypothetical protein MJY56_03280 [Bacteroidales bacterium]|nr:hypothetical protein [Bacteroidales bacterium]
MGYTKLNQEEDEGRRESCLECGDPIRYGRHDKKFCSPECKNRYHNRITKASQAAVRRADTSLSRNYEILSLLLRQGVRDLPLADVVAMGFNISYVTSFAQCGGVMVHYCYDISYRLTRTRMRDIYKVQARPRKK